MRLEGISQLKKPYYPIGTMCNIVPRQFMLGSDIWIQVMGRGGSFLLRNVTIVSFFLLFVIT
jgi:hypothetical protein